MAIKVQDYWSKNLAAFGKALGYAKAQLDTVQRSLKLAGASAEIDKVTASLNKLARANQISQLAADMKAAGATTAQIEAMAAGYNKLADAQERLASAKTLLGKSALTVAAGVGLAATLVEPIKNAAELQKAMVQVQLATGANQAQMKQLTANAMLGGLDTGLSSVMVSEVQKAMSQSGLPLNALLNKNVFSQYLKFADLLYQRNGTPVDQSAAAAVQMSHEYQLYADPKKLADFQNRLWKTLAVTHEGIQPFQQIFSYFAGTANRLGIDANTALSMESFLVRSGLAGNGRSGGADIKDFLQRAASPASKAAATAMEQYGLLDKNGQSVFFKNGRFVGLDQMIDIMQQFSARFHGNKGAEMKAISTIWGQQGGQYALALSGANAKDMNALLQKQISAVPSVDKSQAMQMNTISGQLQRLKVGWQDMMTGLGMPQLSSALNFLKTINGIVTKIVQFELAHPALMKMAGDFVKLASVALVFRGSIMAVAGAGRMINGAFQLTKLFKDFTELSGAAKFLVRDFGAFGGTLKIVGRGIGILGSWVGRITGLSRVFSVGASMARIFAQGFGLIARMAVQVAIAMGPIGWIVTAVTAAIAGLVVAWQHDFGGIREWTAKTVYDIYRFFYDLVHLNLAKLPQDMLKIGQDIVMGLWHGIEHLGSWLASKVMGWISDVIPSPIKRVLGIHSPSRLMAQYGMYTAQGLALGMMNNAHLVSHAANHLANAAVPTSMGVMSSGSSRGGDIHIHEGAIQINGYNKDKRELAREVIAQLGNVSRTHNLSNGIRSNKLAFGHP